ncbi:MAG: hypothetical protein WAU56_15165 [Steroidobacteraceae bacterium]
MAGTRNDDRRDAGVLKNAGCLWRLEAPAVNVFHLEGVHVDAIQAPDIDGGHFCAGLRVRPDCE